MWRELTAAARGFVAFAVAAGILVAHGYSQKADGAAGRSSEGAVPTVTSSEASSLVGQIKEVRSPAFRAYLYSNAASRLWRGAGDDPALRRVASDAGLAGVMEVHTHEREIPAAAAAAFYDASLDVVRRHDAAAAARLEQSYPLQSRARRPEEEKAGASLHTALAMLGDASTAARGKEEALRLIRSGSVPVIVLHGELLRLDRANSPALPQMLSATLALEEQRPGTLPLQTMLFLSPLFFRETTPPALSVRFLALVLRNTRPDSPELSGDARGLAPAARLLRDALPRMQKLAPEMFAAAAAQLAALSPHAPGDALSERLRDSSDPLGELVDAAGRATDVRQKNELLGAAARLAKEQGKLRRAAELLADVVEDRRGLPEGFSGRDELLDGIVQDALGKKDLEVAWYAASKMELPSYRAAALGIIARHLHKEHDAQGAAQTLDEAAKVLDAATLGKGRAVSYFRLVADSFDIDGAKAFDLAREAVKAANAVSLPGDDPEGRAAWSLFLLSDTVVASFVRLAQKDRAGALSLAADLSLRELKLAALLSAYTAQADTGAGRRTPAAGAQP